MEGNNVAVQSVPSDGRSAKVVPRPVGTASSRMKKEVPVSEYTATTKVPSSGESTLTTSGPSLESLLGTKASSGSACSRAVTVAAV